MMRILGIILAFNLAVSVRSLAATDPLEGFKTNENAQFLDSVNDLKSNFFLVKNELFAAPGGFKDRYNSINSAVKDWTVNWESIRLYIQSSRSLPIREVQREVSFKVFDQIEAFHKIRLDAADLNENLETATALLRNSRRSTYVPKTAGDDFRKNYNELASSVDTFAALLDQMKATMYENLQFISNTFDDLEFAFTQMVTIIYLNDGESKISEARRMVQNLFYAERWYRPLGKSLEDRMLAMNSHLVFQNVFEVNRLKSEVESTCEANKKAIAAKSDLDPYYQSQLTGDLNATCTDFLTRVNNRISRWNFKNPAVESIAYKKGLAERKCRPGVSGGSGTVNCKAYAWASLITSDQINAMSERQKANLEKLWWAILKGRLIDGEALGLTAVPQ